MNRAASILLVMIMWVAAATSTMLMGGASGRLITVGGREEWTPNANFSIWASQEKLYVGDWLLFRFDKYQYDIVEVNQTGFESCNTNFVIANLTRGGRDVFQLTEARPYYFTCTKGYCYSGMKVAINVTNVQPPLPTPKANDATSYLYGSNRSIVPLLVLTFSTMLFILMVI